MWSNVTDLFTADGVLEIAGQGLWNGSKGIRRELERDGPPGSSGAKSTTICKSTP